MQMENINQRFFISSEQWCAWKSYLARYLNYISFGFSVLASALLSLVATVEDIGSIVVDSLSKAEGLDWSLDEAGRNQLEEAGHNQLEKAGNNQLEKAGYSLLKEAGRIHLKEAGYSSPVEEHVLVASSSCRLIRFVVVAVGRWRPQHRVYDKDSTSNKHSSSRIRWKWWWRRR